MFVIEDDPPTLDAIVGALRLLDLDVAAFGDAETALRALKSSAPPCVILLDLMMPGITGWDLSDELRRRHEFRSMPIIVVTALPPTQWHPFDGQVIPKPIIWDELVGSLNRLPCTRTDVPTPL